jgi:hypothetical protein
VIPYSTVKFFLLFENSACKKKSAKTNSYFECGKERLDGVRRHVLLEPSQTSVQVVWQQDEETDAALLERNLQHPTLEILAVAQRQLELANHHRDLKSTTRTHSFLINKTF